MLFSMITTLRYYGIIAIHAIICHSIFSLYSCAMKLLMPMTVLFLCLKQKAACAVPVEDSHLEYDFEGQGSSAGSVGCCSLLEDDNDLDFLTELGPKFKTLAEICMFPTMSPKPILVQNVAGAIKSTADFVEPVFKTRQEHIVETKHADIKTERLTSNTNVLQSSVSTVSTAQSMTLPTSKNTTVSRSSHISNYDTLPSPVQTVLLQQEPIYYTSSVSQPIQYVVQPHLQNTLLLVDGSNGTNRFFIQDIERSRNPASHTVPTSPIAFLPISPAMSLGSTEDRKLMQLNGHCMSIKDKSSRN